MMTTIQKGFRCKLEDQVNPANEITVKIAVSGQSVYNYSCFGVDSKEKLSDDRYMVFYNQTNSPQNEIVLTQNNNSASYRIQLAKLPNTIQKLVFTVSIDGNGTMNDISRCAVNVSQNGSSKLSFDLTGKDFQQEKAIIAVEIYRKDVWRLSAVGAGFNGGLSDLLKHYGGEEVVAAPTKLSLEKKLEQEAPALLSLAKPLKLSLDKHKLSDTIAKVALVMDISGSMTNQYRDGIVQEIVNRAVPLAVQFDDDGELDFWYYGSRPRRMNAVNMCNYQQAVPTSWHSIMSSLGYGNHEPAVMQEVITEYKSSNLPAYVLFITDGGVGNTNKIQRLMIESSRFPIFWQFVGVGGSGYGVLQQLDTMGSRYVDNANFFALDDFRKISDTELYDRLLTEFPQWLKEIKQLRMI
jgi:stress response protein SCP2